MNTKQDEKNALIADSAMEYAKDRAEFLSRPDYYAHHREAAAECERAIIELARQIEPPNE